MVVKRRYLKWDFDNDTVTEYERCGECNMCGQCCMAHISYKTAGKRSSVAAPMGDGCEATGVWTEVIRGRMRRFISLTKVKDRGNHICPAYRFSGCTQHAKKSLKMGGQTALCEAWPVVPEHVESFDECSFTFNEIGCWKISEIDKKLDEVKE